MLCWKNNVDLIKKSFYWSEIPHLKTAPAAKGV
jgi:hypothetical protein